VQVPGRFAESFGALHDAQRGLNGALWVLDGPHVAGFGMHETDVDMEVVVLLVAMTDDDCEVLLEA
jgi:hypothetical protein